MSSNSLLVANPGRAPRATIAYEWLKGRLLSGHYAFGEELQLVGIAKEVAVSRQPVMEAVKRLQLEGFVEIIPQVGCRVAVPSQEDAEDLFEVFATLEALVTRLAAERREPADADELKAIASRFEQLRAGAFKVDDYRRLNRDFHSAIHRLSRSVEGMRAAAAYWDRSDFLIATVGGEVGSGGELWADNLDNTVREHQQLADAIIRGDGAAAGACAYQHIRSFGDVVLASLRT